MLNSSKTEICFYYLLDQKTTYVSFMLQIGCIPCLAEVAKRNHGTITTRPFACTRGLGLLHKSSPRDDMS